jgi:hypothetical protein
MVLVSGSSLLPRQIVPTTWLAALGFLGLASLVLMVLVCRTVVFLNLTLN